MVIYNGEKNEAWGNERKKRKSLVLSRSLFKDGGIEDEREGKSKGIIVIPCQAKVLYILS